jgi:hypothetical protein
MGSMVGFLYLAVGLLIAVAVVSTAKTVRNLLKPDTRRWKKRSGKDRRRRRIRVPVERRRRIRRQEDQAREYVKRLEARR